MDSNGLVASAAQRDWLRPQQKYRDISILFPRHSLNKSPPSRPAQGGYYFFWVVIAMLLW